MRVITTDPFVSHILQELEIDHTTTVPIERYDRVIPTIRLEDAPTLYVQLNQNEEKVHILLSLSRGHMCFEQAIIDLNDPNSLTKLKETIQTMCGYRRRIQKTDLTQETTSQQTSEVKHERYDMDMGPRRTIDRQNPP